MQISNSILNNLYLLKSKEILEAGYNISSLKEISYGIQFTVMKDNWTGIVRIFINKKNKITYDLSPIKEIHHKDKLSLILFEQKEIYKTHVATDNVNAVYDNFQAIIGTDESGKGDYFGPLVAAGVYVDQKTRGELERGGIKDSKKVSDKRIPILANLIKKLCFNKYAVIEISPDTYNNLYENFKSEGKNLNTLLAWGHAKAIEEVLNKVDCENVLSDKFADEKFIIGKLQEKGKKINLRQEHKAESNIAVAAASILARARFLEKIKKLSDEHGMSFSKGVSSKVIQEAQLYIEKYGFNQLRKVAKLHFKTTTQIHSDNV